MTRDSVAATDLARLLETERRLGERLRASRAEAEALVERARLAAEQREAALAAEFELDERRMRERLTRERHKREREIAADAERQTETYRRVSSEELGKIARQLEHHLLDDEGT